MIKISIYFNELKSMNDVYNDFVFTGRNGLQVSYEAYSKYLRTISEKVLNRKISVHCLRHTHASLLLAEGVHIETISRRLGHENSKVTKEIYLHVTKKLKNLDNERIQNINIF
jgi:integrase